MVKSVERETALFPGEADISNSQKVAPLHYYKRDSMYLDKQFNEGSAPATDRVSKKYLMPTSIHQIQEQSEEHTDEERKSFEDGYSEESENDEDKRAPLRKFAPLTPSSGTTDNKLGTRKQHTMKQDEQQELFDYISKNRKSKLKKHQTTKHIGSNQVRRESEVSSNMESARYRPKDQSQSPDDLSNVQQPTPLIPKKSIIFP